MAMIPAEVFPLAEYLVEEMEVRGWKSADVGMRMGNARGYEMDAFCFELVLANDDDRCSIDDETFAGMARAFDVSEALLRNLDAVWRKHQDRRAPFEVPDAFFNAGSFPASH